MDWNRVNTWTLTLYALIHSLHRSKAESFENQSQLRANVEEAGTWVSSVCSYSSVLLHEPFRNTLLRFRRDPNVHFDLIVGQVIQMLVQDLVVIFDSMMDDILSARSETAGTFPQSKVEKLATYLDHSYDWAKHGCLELIAARNVLTHAGGSLERKNNSYRPIVRCTAAYTGGKVGHWVPHAFSVSQGNAHLP
jgi:hypothetical protein